MGADLLRAALCVMRQARIDDAAIRAASPNFIPGKPRSPSVEEHLAKQRANFEFRIGGVSPTWKGEADAQNDDNLVLRVLDTGPPTRSQA